MTGVTWIDLGLIVMLIIVPWADYIMPNEADYEIDLE